jgi:hypothetical protein
MLRRFRRLPPTAKKSENGFSAEPEKVRPQNDGRHQKCNL